MRQADRDSTGCITDQMCDFIAMTMALSSRVTSKARNYRRALRLKSDNWIVLCVILTTALDTSWPAY